MDEIDYYDEEIRMLEEELEDELNEEYWSDEDEEEADEGDAEELLIEEIRFWAAKQKGEVLDNWEPILAAHSARSIEIEIGVARSGVAKEATEEALMEELNQKPTQKPIQKLAQKPTQKSTQKPNKK
ncbi:unnamed protein product [Blepharisma stoltei]|uniref:Uncharacterized protein n=1 Tax=Blepharisma stoltei TaxID=1481888 RepID=A0AAU9JHB9_9CILI|nr:unnamed protein product [Blepharisma stoltei]